MSNAMILLLGGVLPAICWGVTAVFQKQSAAAGAHPAHYLVAFGAIIALAGIGWTLVAREAAWSKPGIAYAGLAGATFAIASALLSFTLWYSGAPISRLAPILSCNVLVTVAIGALFLGEGAQLNLPVLGLGTLLIVGGAILVANA